MRADSAVRPLPANGLRIARMKDWRRAPIHFSEVKLYSYRERFRHFAQSNRLE
ncbi:hypothetical protein [Noviherbaspirillum autotrophicum]|uniref:hypothetical protein n=1 Tax=Noviherbaspirillum autotrophicum TaxID=709839 RepID=UPI000B001EFE|nr:hypothetical protein [Noviherbaspirillum autotrophicum]